MRNIRRINGLLICTVLMAASPAPAVPAFSGAEGWGAITPGGRGGQVIHVTNLNDDGPGSFRAAVTASGPRTVVFDVSGQINLLSEVSITNPYLTIAGHTAPGDGIIIAGETVSLDTHDIIVRYMRFRRGAVDGNRRDDALGSDRTTGNIIIDHVSASWGLDENMSVYRNKIDQPIVPGGSTVFPTRNVTIQWSVSSEALNPFSHAFGSTLGGAGVNYHHNLWACNTGRNPSISFSHFFDFRNNVLFNWQHRSVDGAGPEAHVNMINNYYRYGPATQSGQLRYRIVKPELREGTVGFGKAGWWYVEGNYVYGYPSVTANNWNGGVQFDLPGMQESWVRVTTPHTHVEFPDDPDDPNDDINGVPIPIPDLPTIATQSALDAYQWVLAGAGATLPVRDAVDLRVMNMVATGIATFGPNGNGIINSPADVGGYPSIPFVQRPANWDTDQDGMPDAWEIAHGLNPNAADNNGDFDNDGYTNLEDYLNELGAFPAVQAINWDGGNGRYALIDNWDIAFQPSRFDTARISSGVATVDAVGQHAGTLEIGGGAGTAELIVAAGWLKVASSTRALNNGVVHYNGGDLMAGAVELINGGDMLLAAGADKTLYATSITIDTANGSRLDLADNRAIVDYSGSSPIDSIRQLIATGHNGGLWNGNGIVSSMSDAGTFALGYAEAADLGLSSFGGYSIDATAVLIRFTYFGDTDLDGDVDNADFGQFFSHFQQIGQTWFTGDFDYDGDVDNSDFGLLFGNFNSPPLPMLTWAAGSLLPEPAMLGAIVMCLAGATRRSGRQPMTTQHRTSAAV